MRIRSDDELEEQREIRRLRSNKDRWVQALIAALAAVATALGGTTYVQMQEQATDPRARPDSFTGTQAKELEDRVLRDISEKVAATSAYDGARWKEIGEKIERQYQTVQTMAKTLNEMMGKCAEGQVRDSVMREQIKDNRDLLLQHIGATQGGREWHGGRNQHQSGEE